MKLKVAILSCAPAGGAGIAAKRLADALMEREDLSCDFIDATMLGGLPGEAIYNGSASNRSISDTHFTAEHPGFVRQWLVNLLAAYDVLNFHWATMMVTVSEILELANRGKRIVLTMHDFFYATGGCHYQAGCDGQGRGCIHCPQVDETIYSRVSVAHAFREKMLLLRHENVTITAPSHYLANRIRELIGAAEDKVRVIRNPYKAEDKIPDVFMARTESAHKVMIIADSFGERRKNILLSIDAVAVARRNYIPSLQLHLVGCPTPEVLDYCNRSELDIVTHGHIPDPNQLAELYKKCGILISCSSDDNWPNVLVEACVHGTVPVVGPGHGCEEFVREYGLDLIASDYSAEAFAFQISRAFKLIKGPLSGNTIGKMTERIIRDHSPDRIGNVWSSLFTSADSQDGMLPKKVMKRLVLHIGIHKSGSSSIQDFLSRILKGGESGRDVEYLQVLDGSPNNSAAFCTIFRKDPELYHYNKGLSAEAVRSRNLDWTAKLRDRILGSNSRTMIASAEDLCVMSGDGLTKLRDFFHGHGFEIDVYAYIRSPHSYIESAFQQMIKEGRSLGTGYFDFRALAPRFVNLEVVADVFGSERLYLRKFDPALFPKGDVVRDFIEWTNIPKSALGADALPAAIVMSNSGLRLEALAILYFMRMSEQINFMLKAAPMFERSVIRHLEKFECTGKVRLQHSVTRSARDQLAESLDWLAKRGVLLDNESGDSDDNSLRIGTPGDFGRLITDDLIERAADLILSASSNIKPGGPDMDVLEIIRLTRLELESARGNTD